MMIVFLGTFKRFAQEEQLSVCKHELRQINEI